MMAFVELLALFSIFQFEPLNNTTRDLAQLDEARLRKGLERTFGEFTSKRPSEWKVAIQGRTETWTWDGEKFKCPRVAEGTAVDCEAWTPASFKWFMSGTRWLDPWVSMRRKGFFLGQPEAKSSLPVASLESAIGPEALGEEEVVPEEDEEVPESWNWDGKRLASQVWEWVARDGQVAQVFVSLRNAWIERIDPDIYSAEYIEWKKANRWSRPEVTKVILDKNGQRISFEHQKNLK